MSLKRKTGKLLKRMAIIFAILFTVGLLLIAGINLFVKATAQGDILSKEDVIPSDADCILVLGAGVWANNRPSFMLEDRLLTGISLYETGASERILMSGDHGTKEYDEVNVMKLFAVERGVPSEHIFMDHAGFSTYESLYRARDVFKTKKMIIVTQKYHLYRALYIAKSLGIEAIGVSADLREYKNQGYRDAREIFARVKDFFYCISKPKPTYLGETIPVSGDGNLTND